MKDAALRAGILAGGSALGIGVYNWNFANPMAFEGGPMWQLARDSITLAGGGGTEFEVRAAKSNMQRFASEFWFPFGAAAHDLGEAMEEPDPLIATALGLGFNIETTKDRIRNRRER